MIIISSHFLTLTNDVFPGGLSPAGILSILEDLTSGSELDISDSDEEYIPPRTCPDPNAESETDTSESIDLEDAVRGPDAGPSGDRAHPAAERRLFFRLSDSFGIESGAGIETESGEATASQSQTFVRKACEYFRKFVTDEMTRQIAEMTNRRQVAFTGQSLC